MSRQRYNKTESLNRILRILQGKSVPQDTPETVSGVVLNETEALSDIAELLANSLPNETLSTPAGMITDMAATVAQANAGTDNDVFLTPVSHGWSHEYGGIYTASGTVYQNLVAETWTKITGSFQNEMLNSGNEVRGDWENGYVEVNEAGTYMVRYAVCLENYGDAATLGIAAHINTVRQPQIYASLKFGASGTVDASKELVAFGSATLPTLAPEIDLRVKSSVETIVKVDIAQLTAEKLVG